LSTLVIYASVWQTLALQYKAERRCTDKLLTLAEVAEMTRLSENTMRWLRHQDKGPKAGKLGRRLVYREKDVIAWVNDQFANDGKAAS